MLLQQGLLLDKTATWHVEHQTAELLADAFVQRGDTASAVRVLQSAVEPGNPLALYEFRLFPWQHRCRLKLAALYHRLGATRRPVESRLTSRASGRSRRPTSRSSKN